jgi:hypothetical protein
MTKNKRFFIAIIFYPRKNVKQDSYMTFQRYVAALQYKTSTGLQYSKHQMAPSSRHPVEQYKASSSTVQGISSTVQGIQ